VTHVQFDPTGSGRIVFNREGWVRGTGRPLPDRIWCLEANGTFHPLATEAPDEWRSHENWSPTGSGIVYHGNRAGQPFLAERTWAGELVSEMSMAGLETYHVTASIDGRRLFMDRPNGMISSLDPSHSERGLTDICQHRTSMKDQDTHAHPITTPSGRSLIFTSDRGGNCDVYEVGIASVTS
jgi:Tol biopolymer transport system component